MYAIYAWMRAADDLVDAEWGEEPSHDRSAARQAVDEFRAHTVEALAGRSASDGPVWRALAAVARAYPLDINDFHGMLDGQLSDIGPRTMGTFTELDEYCRQVASTVGCVCIAIWGYSDRRAIELAIDRGIAFQLTNIVRDIREDAGVGRVYLPREALERAGVTIEDLCRWDPADRSRLVVEAMIARARSHYEASAPLEGLIERSCRPTLWALTQTYRGLLERIAADPEQVVRRRVSLPLHRKVAIALRARLLGSQQ